MWGKTDTAYAFLQSFLTVEQLKALLPDLAEYEIDRYEMPNLKALNFYIRGILGDGVSANNRLDGQAKSLGEYLRSRSVDVPADLAAGHHHAMGGCVGERDRGGHLKADPVGNPYDLSCVGNAVLGPPAVPALTDHSALRVDGIDQHPLEVG